MKNWENMTEQERKEHDKKVLKKRIMGVVNFIVGVITLLIMAAGTDYIGERFFGADYCSLIGAIIFFGIMAWNSKVGENIKKEKNDKIEDDKQEVFDELRKLRSQINEMSESGEIDINAAEMLENSISEVHLKISEINIQHNIGFFK